MREGFRLWSLVVSLLILGCASTPYAAEQVNPHLWRSSQPVTAADWQDLAAKLGRAGVIVKLNDPGEGSDDGAAAAGLVDVDLHIEPQGDGPLTAQLAGIFQKPDAVKVQSALALMCDPRFMVDVHCTHGMDRTGFLVAQERVLCEGWPPEKAHEEWHRKAKYFPFGDRIPSPGLEAAWDDFVKGLRAPATAALLLEGAQGVIDALR